VSIAQQRGYIEITSLANRLRARNLEGGNTGVWENIIATKDSILQKLGDIIHPIYLESSGQLDILFHDFSTGQVIAVSDGSYFPGTNRISAAWIIESKCQTQWIMGSILTPGPTEDFSAYRSELAGLIAITITLKILACCLPSPRHIIIGCDSQAALQSLTMNREDITSNSSHSDLRSMMVDLWATMTTHPYPVHIKGHQDKTANKLSRLECLNILMDKLATLTASTFPNPRESLCITKFGLPGVTLNNTHISGQLVKTLYIGLTGVRLRQYLHTNVIVETVDINIIDFNAFGQARSQAPRYLNLFMSKWLSNTLPTGIVMQKRNHRIFNRCPRCNHWGEDHYHITKCWDTRANLIWNSQIRQLQKLFAQQKTCPVVSAFLTQSLQKIRSRASETMDDPNGWQHELSQIGWMNICIGFLGKQLIQHQDSYCKSIGLRKTGTRWAGRVIIHLWDTIHKMWISRNDGLYKKDIINALSGRCLLDIEVEKDTASGPQMVSTI
jgi:hypothetical protein